MFIIPANVQIGLIRKEAIEIFKSLQFPVCSGG